MFSVGDNMNEVQTYHYLLRQEVLKETASDEFNRLVNYMCKYNLSEDDNTPYAKLFWEMSSLKNRIISDANNNDNILDVISKQIKVFHQRIDELAV